MRIHETGIILFTANYDAMVEFYRDVLQLPIRAARPEFYVFHWGLSYLMVEPFVPGHAIQSRPSGLQPQVIRFNVFDLHESVRAFAEQNIDVVVQSHAWGTIATLFDPDGNLIELKDAPDFFE
jgi:catechol 2,3-dioxygenase-like lactoylglutathione lyase family enzyme